MNKQRLLVTSLDTRSDKAISALFGKIKTNIDFSFPDREKICLMVTSSLYSEGKSTIAANTALAMAMSGKKTLLLDADMIKPMVHQLFGYINGVGLFDAISTKDDWQQFVIESSIPNLYVMTSGKTPLLSAKFLGSMRFKSILENMRTEYDYIIIDTPPVLAVPDAQILSSLTDGVLLIIRHGKTKIEALKNAREALTHANANIIGAVMNDKTVKDTLYYGYEYDYGNAKRTNRIMKQSKAVNSRTVIKLKGGSS